MNTSQTHACSLAAILLAVCPPIASASIDSQIEPTPPNGFRVDNVLNLEELGLGTNSVVQRVGWGDFRGDHTGALVSLIDGVLNFSTIPYELNALVHVEGGAGGVLDFAVVEDDAGGHDLLAVDDRGLLHFPENALTGGFDAPIILEAGLWRGVSKLRTAQLSGASETFVAGLALDGKTIMLGDISGGTWTALAPTTMPLDVIDFAMFDDQDDGSMNFAVVLPVGLFFYHQGGAYIGRWTSTSTTVGGVVPFYSTDATQNQHSMVAWWRVNALGTYELVAADSSAQQAPVALLLQMDQFLVAAERTARSLAADFFDGDRNQDVLVTLSESAAVVFTNNYASNPNKLFDNDWGDYEVFTTGPSGQPVSGTTTNAEVCLIDFDFEGFANPVLVNEEEDSIILFKGEREDPSGDKQTGFISNDMVSSQSTYFVPDPAGGGTALFNLALNVPPKLISEEEQDHDYLQVVVFYQDDPNGDLEPLAVGNVAYPLHNQEETTHWVPIDLLAPGDVPITNPTWFNPQHHFWVVYRFIRFNSGNNGIQSSTPFYTVSMTVQETTDDQSDLEFAGYMVSITEGSIAGTLFHNLDPGSGLLFNQGVTYVGAFVPQDETPVFPSGTNPVPGLLQFGIPTADF